MEEAKPKSAVIWLQGNTPVNTNNSIVLYHPKEFNYNLKIFKLLEDFEHLEDNWDGDGALAIPKSVITQAKTIMIFLDSRGLKIFHTAPGPNGEIMIDLRNRANTKSLELIIYSTRNIAIKFPSHGKPEQDFFDILNLSHFLNWLYE
ncbi:MAG: hypothetical protein ACK4WD_02395 [Flavobacteriales bacterium]